MTMNVLFLAAEAEPYVKIGGLGDVAGALPQAVSQFSKTQPIENQADIRLVLPYHYVIKQKNFPLTPIGNFSVPSQVGPVECRVFLDEHADIPVYLLDGAPIDEKSPVYALDPIQDGYKFVFFSLAALHLTRQLNWRVDILQANDWHTASAIYALALGRVPAPELARTKSILSLHNLPYMGFGIQEALSAYGLPPTPNKILPEWARHAALPLGLLHADRILAVSPHYAEEILTPEFGCGLEDFLQTRESALSGIINGLDTDRWNPKTDPNIVQNFSLATVEDRYKNKLALQKLFNLNPDAKTPLLTLISRMDHQKGIDIALRGLTTIMDQNWQAIILGTGNPDIEAMALSLARVNPDRVRSVIDFDSHLAHQLYAGADIFMMPSRYEPCGLSQMISMRYGCIPVARATGGLVNTITHFSRNADKATGFLFQKPYPSRFARMIKRALKAYQQPKIWRQLQINGMSLDFSWQASAEKYMREYQDLITQ